MNNTITKKHNNQNIFFKIFVLSVCIMFAYKIIAGESNVFTVIAGFLGTLKPIFFAMFIAYILYIPAKRIELFLEKSKNNYIIKGKRNKYINSIFSDISTFSFVDSFWWRGSCKEL